jgi:hypothetical protein
MSANPWYREPWPWLLMSGPAIVVVAGIVTMVIAVRTSDGLVADDYYKQGLAIDRVIAREERARALGVAAAIAFNDERDRVRVTLASTAASPTALRLTLVHPTRSGEDQVLALSPVAPGLYEGTMRAPRAGAWTLLLEDGASSWRVSCAWRTGDARVVAGEVPP